MNGVGAGSYSLWESVGNEGPFPCDSALRDPPADLRHELTHADRIDRGAVGIGRLLFEEFEVTKADNFYRRSAGLGLRTVYGCLALPTPLVNPCGVDIDCARCNACLVGACITCQLPTACNVAGRCSECGDGVIENGEECDGSAPHDDCSSQGCRSNCTIDCGTCMACIGGGCADISPPDLKARWAILHVRHTSTGEGCLCGPDDCSCVVGAFIGVQFYACDTVSHPGYIADCVQGGSSATPNAPFGCDIPECDPFRILEREWDELRSCPPPNCGGPKQGCLPSDAPEDAPPLGTCFDLRLPLEQAAGCCSPPSGCNP